MYIAYGTDSESNVWQDFVRSHKCCSQIIWGVGLLGMSWMVLPFPHRVRSELLWTTDRV